MRGRGLDLVGHGDDPGQPELAARGEVPGPGPDQRPDHTAALPGGEGVPGRYDRASGGERHGHQVPGDVEAPARPEPGPDGVVVGEHLQPGPRRGGGRHQLADVGLGRLRQHVPRDLRRLADVDRPAPRLVHRLGRPARDHPAPDPAPHQPADDGLAHPRPP